MDSDEISEICIEVQVESQGREQTSVHMQGSEEKQDEVGVEVKVSEQNEPKVENEGESNQLEAKKSDEEPKIKMMSWAESFQTAIRLWCQSIILIALPLSAGVLTTVIFYLPAVVLTSRLLKKFEPIIYGTLGSLMWGLSKWATLVFIITDTFSFQFSKKAIALGCTPAYITDSLYNNFSNLSTNLIGNISNAMSLVFTGFIFYLVYKSEKPEIMAASQEVYYNLTKDGTVMALYKGLVAIFILIAFLFYNILGNFIGAHFFLKFMLRFILYPLCFGLSKWIQQHMLRNLPKQHAARRLVIYKLCNYYIKFMGRILISNFTTEGALSLPFVSVNLMGAIFEIFSTILFKLEAKVHFRVKRYGAMIYRHFTCSHPGRKLVPILPGENEPQAIQDTQINLGKDHVEKEECIFVNEWKLFRLQNMRDEMLLELYSLILAPLLMYLIQPLYSHSSFQLISSLNECFFQILIQLFFEMLSDVCCLAYEIRQGNLTQQFNQRYTLLRTYSFFVWSIYCTFNVAWTLGHIA